MRRGALLLLLLGLVAAGACGGGARGSRGALGSVAPTSSATTAVSGVTSVGSTTPATAMAAYDAFVAGYWDPNTDNFFKNSDHQINSMAAVNLVFSGQFYSDFWWEAHLLELTLDAYELSGSAALRQQIDTVYDGFVAMPWHEWTVNPYNDDLTWWALALARAYEVTGETRFRDRAAAIVDSVAAFEDPTFGGGVWWKRDGTLPSKNVCIDAPFVMAALYLYSWTSDPAYLERARRVYAWMQSRLVQGSTVYDNVQGTGAGTLGPIQFTYNYGTYIGASLALADATSDASYVANAVAAADEAMATLCVNGVLKDEGSGDASGFKMILTRYLCRLAPRGHPGIATFLDVNASTAWSNRRADGLMSEDWSSPAPTGSIQSFASASAADVQFHALLARAPLAPTPAVPSTAASVAPFGNVTITADKATRSGVSLGTQLPGYTGVAYVTSWTQGSTVAFTVNAATAGQYLAAFRYSAGAGDASRTVAANGATVVTFSLAFPASAGLTFPVTPSWSDWQECCALVPLVQGSNVVSIGFDAASGSAGAMNLDSVTIAPSPAR